MPEPKDFFVSYNKADRGMAEWIAYQLEEADYSTIIQAWDFQPGCNFVQEMDRAAEQARRTIAVLSPDYLAALYTRTEWSAALADDPTGEGRKLVPVLVRPCELKGLLGQIVSIDLVDLTESEARQKLIDGVELRRRKPAASPAFLGSSNRPAFPVASSTGANQQPAPAAPAVPAAAPLPAWEALPKSARRRIESLLTLIENGDFAALRSASLGLTSSDRKVLLVRQLHAFASATVTLQQHLTTGNLATLGADLAACLRPLAEPEGLYSAYTDVVRRAVLVFCVQFTSVAGPREREDIVGAAETFARQRADHVLLRQLQPLTAQP